MEQTFREMARELLANPYTQLTTTGRNAGLTQKETLTCSHTDGLTYNLALGTTTMQVSRSFTMLVVDQQQMVFESEKEFLGIREELLAAFFVVALQFIDRYRVGVKNAIKDRAEKPENSFDLPENVSTFAETSTSPA